MAFAVNLQSYDLTLSLQTGGITLLRYAIEGSDPDTRTVDGIGDGEVVNIPDLRNVTESLDLMVEGATASEVQAKIGDIERIVYRKSGQPAYILMQMDDDTLQGYTYRSEILSAKVSFPKVLDQVWRRKVEGTVTFTRRYYWETTSRVTAALTSPFQATPTANWTQTTHNSTQNWFQAVSIEGTLPTPLIIELKNNSGVTRTVSAVYFANAALLGNPTIAPALTGGQANAGATKTWTGTTETDTHTWNLSLISNIDVAYNGRYGRVMGVFTDAPQGTTLARARQSYAGSALYRGELLQGYGHPVLDLGAMPIPPGALDDSLGYSMANGLDLIVSMQAGSAGGDSVVVNWIQVMPAGPGLFRKLVAAQGSTTLVSGVWVVDSGPTNTAGIHYSGGVLPLMRPYGPALYAWPGKTNRIHYLVDSGGTLEAGVRWDALVQYRPRRATIGVLS